MKINKNYFKFLKLNIISIKLIKDILFQFKIVFHI